MSGLIIFDEMPVYSQEGFVAIDAAAIGLTPDLLDPYMLDKLGALLEHIDRVVVACPPSKRSAWSTALKSVDVRAELLLPDFDALQSLGVSRFGTTTTLLVAVGPLSLSNRAKKRALDLSVALIALFFLGPLLILTACLVKADSEGPIFFSQSRVGRANRLFSIYKFRSMTVAGSDLLASRLTTRDDQRVTRVGRFIRATSIDELPQILNVLKGEMSLVGPRPHALGALAGDELYWAVDERYWNRHSTKPGITGLAQVRGFRGSTHLQEDLVNRLQADLDYLNGWTIWRDIKIIILTIRVLIHNNAY